MNRNTRMLWLLAILWLATTFMLYRSGNQQRATLPDPAAALEQVQAKEKTAGNDPDELKRTIKSYRDFVGKYPKTEYAAEAFLRIGIIQETKLGQEQAAIGTYQKLVREFPPAESKAGSEARERLTTLEEEIDRRHSQQIGYKAIDWLVATTGRNPKYSYALALLFITIVVKVVTTPLSRLQFKYMREMQKLQPLVKQLQEKYKNNQQEIGKRLMALYKEHGVNPFSSCLPLLIQMPVLILLYKYVIIAYQFQFAKGKFLWIGSGLAERFPSIVAPNLFQPDIPLLLIYTVSMIISQKLTIVDPSQAEQQKMMAYMMPIIFAFLFRTFPSALMLYWLMFNILSTVQQYLILRQPAGPGGPAAGREEVGPPAEPPKRVPTSPGKARRKRHRRRFDALRLPHPAWRLMPGGETCRGWQDMRLRHAGAG